MTLICITSSTQTFAIIYRISAAFKVETDIIASIVSSPIGRV